MGIPRAISYTRYLPRCGCEVFVVAPRWPATPVYDPSLERLVPPGTVIRRAFNPEVPYKVRDYIWKRSGAAPKGSALKDQAAAAAPAAPGLLRRTVKGAVQTLVRHVATPDVQAVWQPFAYRAACSLIERHNIGTLLCNIPPYSITGTAVKLKRRYPHLKLIADFRDDWVGYYIEQFDVAMDRSKREQAVAMERAVMEAADFVTGVTPMQASNMAKRYPELRQEKFLAAPNGYEPGAFEGFTPRRHDQAGRMVITYFGSLYANPAYSPHVYLNAVDALDEPLRRQIDTRLIGRVSVEARPLIENRRSRVISYGFLPRDQGLRYLEETDYLLIIGLDESAHAGKLFDYLGTGKPILAITPPHGELARLVRETRTGWVADPHDPEAIRALLTGAWERLQRGEARVEPDRAAVESYAWPNLVASLARRTGMARPGV
ncbi:MAG: hypothetical protein IT162_12370 [Bryobacterales bacterium]|nr:hypothetical protein [Bryobacterales bacterium]